jgi:GNAT superfamily N-acetyltransferase
MTPKNHNIDKLTFKALEESDIAFGMELKNIAGWNQIESDWRRYLLFEPNGCFSALYEGEPVGTATTINYEKRFGWIGMVLVHPLSRRKGIGTALLCKAIEYLKGIGVEAIKLDATPEGRKVYIPMGFLDEYELDRRQGVGSSINCDEFPPIQKADIEDIIGFDAKAFGADRGKVLKSLFYENPDKSFLARNNNGAIAGYITARNGLNAYHIGPWVSNSFTLADELFSFMLKKLDGKKIFLDTPRPNNKGVEIVEKHGFLIQRGFVRMFLGKNSCPGNVLQIYATSGAEKG